MTFTILLYVYRKEGTTPSAFRTYYDNNHIPLAKSIFGPAFPITHTRRYVQRSDEDGNAAVLIGTQEDVPYDAVSELVFEDKEHFEKFMARFAEEKERLEKDEANFAKKGTRDVVFVVDGVSVSARD